MTNKVSKLEPKNTRGPKSRGLGRGLDALLGDASAKKTTIKENPFDAKSTTDSESDTLVPIEFLQANPNQPRKVFNDDAIAELAASIKQTGLLQPILVRPIKGAKEGEPRYEIVAGERRWRASQKAAIHKVPVIVRELTDTQTAEIAIIENVQRVDLNPLEEAEAYHFLSKNHGRNQEDIAKAVGKSRSHIANIMRLTGLPKKAQSALSQGQISMGHARALLASSNITEHLAETLSKSLSVRQLETLIKTSQNNATKKDASSSQSVSASKKDADTRALERNLAETLGLDVSIDHQSKGDGRGTGTVTISYLDLDQLDEVCRRLMGSPV